MINFFKTRIKNVITFLAVTKHKCRLAKCILASMREYNSMEPRCNNVIIAAVKELSFKIHVCESEKGKNIYNTDYEMNGLGIKIIKI